MSIRKTKSVHSLQVSDLEKHPVWQFVASDAGDETGVQPVNRLPVSNLMGRIVGTRILFANGEQAWALVGNLDTTNARMNEHFVTLSVARNGGWFGLARYHDAHYRQCGPNALARFMGLSVDDVFPIFYDVRKYANGKSSALAGTVLKKPRIRLTKAELIAQAVS